MFRRLLMDDYLIQSNYFYIEAIEDDCGVTFSKLGMLVSRDLKEWSEIGPNSRVTLSAGLRIYCKNELLLPVMYEGLGRFGITGGFCNIGGNLLSLLFGDNFENLKDLTGKDFAFTGLFTNCSTIISAGNLILSAEVLASYCYSGLFSNCTNLIAAPKIPDAQLASDCYSSMFESCTNLQIAPELPSTTLTWGCYRRMFNGCTNLTKAPKLPSTLLASYCYSGMFSNCASLIEVPELPAVTLLSYCYESMFSGCINLEKAPSLPSLVLASNCYYDMFLGCINLIKAPLLNAPTLVNHCYSGMFKNCSKLADITALFLTEPGRTYTRNWVSGVSPTGTFTKNTNATWDVTGVNGIPENWDVLTAEY